jgi:hypothetical protein
MSARALPESVEEAAWREVVRLRADWSAVENALGCDAYRLELDAAARALQRLSVQANKVAAALRAARALPEPEQ